MDTDRVTTSTLRKRRLTALLLSTLVATSLLIATPSTQKPAYGLVEAGFVDAVGRYGRISVDGSGGASCIWRQVCCCLGQYSSPSLWDMGRIILLWCSVHYRDRGFRHRHMATAVGQQIGLRCN